MLHAINAALRETIEATKALNKACKNILSATVARVESRDLRQLLDEHKIETSGSGRMTKYRKAHD
jgi:hypothetical protein